MGNSSPDKARSMAWLYVNGPQHLRGKWNACSEIAGYARPPRQDSKQLQQFIAEFSSQSTMVAELLAGGNDSSSWEDLAERARPVLAKIAAGQVFASAQQIAALREIVNRGEGRVGAKAQDESEIGVVVLPKLGDGEKAELCPACVERLEQDMIREARSLEA